MLFYNSIRSAGIDQILYFSKEKISKLSLAVITILSCLE